MDLHNDTRVWKLQIFTIIHLLMIMIFVPPLKTYSRFLSSSLNLVVVLSSSPLQPFGIPFLQKSQLTPLFLLSPPSAKISKHTYSLGNRPNLPFPSPLVFWIWTWPVLTSLLLLFWFHLQHVGASLKLPIGGEMDDKPYYITLHYITLHIFSSA